MGSSPTRRLIDATAKLEPADRALLNLWLNRGFDDQRLAMLTGMSAESVIGRRERLIGRLSDDLTLPPGDVQQALREMATGEMTGEPPAPDDRVEISRTNGHAGPDTVQDAAAGLLLGPAALADRPALANGSGLLLGPGALTRGPALTPEPTATIPAGLLLGPAAAHPSEAPAGSAASPGPEERPGPRRRTIGLAAALVVLAGIIAVVLLVTVGGHASHRPRAQTHSAPTAATLSPSTTAASTPATSSSPAPAPAKLKSTPPAPIAFAGLPGGLKHARGSVQLVGPVRHLRLKLTVSSLPSAHRGHYQVWLFNTVLDSRSLGRLRAGVRSATYRLPSHARRYRWIDVSFQPLGYVNHSGESELRAANPAHTSLARLHRRAARKRRQLRRATSGSKKASTSK